MNKKVEIHYKLDNHVHTLPNVFIDLGTMEIVDERSLVDEKNPICYKQIEDREEIDFISGCWTNALPAENNTDGIEEDEYETTKMNWQSMNYIKDVFCTNVDETNLENGIILDGKIGWVTKTYG